MTKIYSRKVYFRDLTHNSCSVEIELEQENERWKLDYETMELVKGNIITFHVHLDTPTGGSIEGFPPRTDSQKQLIALIQEYDGNTLQPGTKAQQYYLDSKLYEKQYNMLGEMYCGYPDNMRHDVSGWDLLEFARKINSHFLEKPADVDNFLDVCKHMDDNHPVEYILGLNDSKSNFYGTPHSQKDYQVRCLFLAINGLLIDRKYKYGSSWLMKRLPRNMETELDCLLNGIVVEERDLTKELDAAFGIDKFLSLATDEERIRKITQLRSCSWTEARDFIALSKYLGISYGNLNDTFEHTGKCLYKVGGREYYVGDEDDLEEVANTILHGDYGYEDIWRDSVANGGITQGLEDWLDDVLHIDGWVSVLNHYDGQYKTYRVDHEEICVCRTD